MYPLPLSKVHLLCLLFASGMFVSAAEKADVHEEWSYFRTDVLYPEPVREKSEVGSEYSDEFVPAKEVVVSPSLPGGGVSWAAQNRLRIQWPDGVPARAAYTVSLPPGSKYLSGRDVVDREIAVKSPPMRMYTWRDDNDPIGEVWVFGGRVEDYDYGNRTSYPWTHEGRNLDANVPVVYTYEYSFGEGSRLIPGKVYPVRVGDPIPDRVRLEMEKKGVVFNRMPTGTAVKGVVRVLPSESLSGGRPSSENGLHWSSKDGNAYPVEGGLHGFTIKDFSVKEVLRFNAAKRGVTVELNAPVWRKDVPALFRDGLALEADGSRASLAEDGTLQAVLPGGGKAVFSLLPLPKGGDKVSGFSIGIQSPDVFRLKVGLKSCARSASGLVSLGKEEVSIDMKAYTPHLGMNVDHSVSMWHGKHAMGLTVQNIADVQLSAKAVPPEAARGILRRMLDASRKAALMDRERFETAQSMQVLNRQMESRNLTPEQRENGMERLRDLGAKLTKRDAVCKDVDFAGVPHAAQGMTEWKPEAPSDPMAWDPQRKIVDLDAMFGGALKPGLYVVEARGTNTALATRSVKRFGYETETGSDQYDPLASSYGDKTENYAFGVLQVTDLGIWCRVDGRKMLCYVYSMKTGAPVPDARVELSGADGGTLSEASTDAQGVAELSMDGKADVLRVSKGDDCYLAMVASREEGDADYVSGEGVGYNYYYSDGDTRVGMSREAARRYPAQRRVMMFTDRSIYRPGDEVHLKGIVRGHKGNDVLQMKPEKAVLTLFEGRGYDSPGKEIASVPVVWTPFGTFSTSFKLPAGVVGNYDAVLYLPDGKGGLALDMTQYTNGNRDPEGRMERRQREFSIDIPVQEFRRNAFDADLAVDAAPIAGKTVQGAISTKDYAGYPVADGKVAWVLSAEQASFNPAGYGSFVFAQCLWWGDRDDGFAYYNYRDSQEKVTPLGKDGKASVEMALKPVEQPVPVNVFLSTDTANGREEHVTQGDVRLIHPASYYIGLYHEVGEYSPIYRAQESAKMRVVLVDTKEKPWPKPEQVDVVIMREYNEPQRYMSDDDVYRTHLSTGVMSVEPRRSTVRNDKYRKVVYRTKMAVDPRDSVAGETAGALLEFTPYLEGKYWIELTAKDDAGRPVLTRSSFQVAGRRNGEESSWEANNDESISISPEKMAYKPGETARLLVKTGLEGHALVCVEREGVLRRYVREIRKENPVIEIPVLESDAPNVYLSLVMVRGADASKRRYKVPVVASGTASYNVEPVDKKLEIAFDLPKESVLPGSGQSVSGAVKDASGAPVRAEVTFYAVDEGMLSITGYGNPNPLSFFMQERPCCVGSANLAEGDLLVPGDWRWDAYGNKGTFIGGGGDAAPMGCSSGRAAEQMLDENGHVRKDFRPTACWLAQLETDADGRFTAAWENPDTLTKYRVIAVAVDTKDRFGSAAGEYIVSKPVMVTPGVPVFASEGDRLRLPVTVANTTDKAGKWSVALGGEPAQTVDLPAHGQATLYFMTEYKETGPLTMRCTAAPASLPFDDPKLSDKVEQTFDVLFPSPTLGEVYHAVLDAEHPALDVMGLVSQQLQASRHGDLDVTLSTSPIPSFMGNVAYLLNYPHGCVEQTASATLPWIMAGKLRPYSPVYEKMDANQVSDAVQAGADKILSRQNLDGGFGYWEADGKSCTWATPYAGYVLLLAREAGAFVPQKAVDSLCTFLSKIDISNNPREAVFGAWVLAKAGKPDKSLVNRLLDRSSSLDTMDRLYLALALVENGAGDESSRKAAEALLHLSPSDGEGWMPRRTIDNLKLMVRCKLHPEKASAAWQEWSRTHRDRGEYTTWGSGWTLLAISSYLDTVKAGGKDAEVRIDAMGGSRTQKIGNAATVVSGDAWKTGNGAATLRDIKPALQCLNGATVYATIEVKAKPDKIDYPGVSESGLLITRVYEKKDASGKWKPTDEFRVGDVVRVTLSCTKSPLANKSLDLTDYEYFALVDYLPSCMEAVNPAITSQQLAGPDDDYAMSGIFDHREFHKDRVASFASRWIGDSVLNMSYLARVTRAGEATAPPAKAELMYEPQVHGLSPNRRIIVIPAEGGEWLSRTGRPISSPVR